MQDIEDYANTAEEGLIVFSLGVTLNAEDIPLDLIEAFLTAFSRLQQRVIMKVDRKFKVSLLSENIMLVDWFPQQALLGNIM